tara:strand:- start:127 stop:351 length:225 start_codon:yes stop_codon:yes gene_type:complete
LHRDYRITRRRIVTSMDLTQHIAGVKRLPYSRQTRQSNGWIDPIVNPQTTTAKLDHDLTQSACIKRVDHPRVRR